MPTIWNQLSDSSRSLVGLVVVTISGLALGGIMSVATGGLASSSAMLLVGFLFLLALMGVGAVVLGLLSAKVERLVSPRRQ